MQWVISWECWTMYCRTLDFVKFFCESLTAMEQQSNRAGVESKPFSIFRATKLPGKCKYLAFLIKGKWEHGPKNTRKKTEKSSVTDKHSLIPKLSSYHKELMLILISCGIGYHTRDLEFNYLVKHCFYSDRLE